MTQRPIELSLVHETQSCRQCQWFWGPTPPYGPFPAYTFTTEFPPEVSRAQTTPVDESRFWLKGECRSLQKAEPAMLHGCRKAPIMTIGINPNLGGFFPTPIGSRYIYPHFADNEAASYAYYYRYRSIYQEQVAPEVTRAWLDRQRPILTARTSGVVISVSRGMSHRFVEIHVLAADGVDHVHELAWGEHDAPAILVKKDDVVTSGQELAGFLAPPDGGQVDVFTTPVSYYQRFQEVLRRLELNHDWDVGSLLIGEDVSQGDMVGCASPGWKDNKSYDLAAERIATNCVSDKRFLLRQLLQSRPAVLVFSGRSALSLFGQAWPGEPWLEEWSQLDAHALLRRCSNEPRFLKFKDGSYEFSARVLCGGHFSYENNYIRGARMAEGVWRDFKRRFPEDARRIGEAQLVREEPQSKILIDMRRDDLHRVLSPSAWQELREGPGYSDPVQTLADALSQEVEAGRLKLDPVTKRLKRGAGGCNFCVNKDWRFPEGCAYASASQQASEPAASIDTMAEKIARAPTTRPDAVRLWRGMRLPSLSKEKFDRAIVEVFVPATVDSMGPLGLTAYQPTLLANEAASSGLSELALVAYKTRDTYERAKGTPAGKKYGAQHADCFILGQNEPKSRTDYADIWRDASDRGQPYSLYDLRLDLQQGVTELLVGRFSREQEQALDPWLTTMRRNKPAALTGYFFVLEADGLFLRWAHFFDGDVKALGEPPMLEVLRTTATAWELPAQGAPSRTAPLQPGRSLNVLFKRA